MQVKQSWCHEYVNHPMFVLRHNGPIFVLSKIIGPNLVFCKCLLKLTTMSWMMLWMSVTTVIDLFILYFLIVLVRYSISLFLIVLDGVDVYCTPDLHLIGQTK